MTRTFARPLLAAVFCVFAANHSVAANPSTDKLNQQIDKLTLPGPDGKPVVVAAPKGGAAVVVFLSFDCPV
jgi:hypothetical protein